MKTLKEYINEAKLFSSDLKPEIDRLVKNCPLKAEMDTTATEEFRTVLTTLSDMGYRMIINDPAVDPYSNWKNACFYPLCKGDNSADMALVACFLRFGRFKIIVYTNKKSNITLEKREESSVYGKENISDIAVNIDRPDLVGKIQVNGQERLYEKLAKAEFGSISRFIEKAKWYTKACYYTNNDNGYSQNRKNIVKIYSVYNFYE